MGQRVYASLVGPFLGYYVKVPYANNEEEARLICSEDKRLHHLWCAIYSLEEVEAQIIKFGGLIIELYKHGLEFDMAKLEELRNAK